MGMFRMITAVTVLVSFLLLVWPCAAASTSQVNDHKSFSLVDNNQAKFSLLPSLLPRKLIKINKDATHVKSASDNKELNLRKELMEDLSGKKIHKKEENVMRHASNRGITWREWADQSPQKSEYYYTMDYNWVRRRRPIHNKQIPFSP